jgi:hypothetical protein
MKRVTVSMLVLVMTLVISSLAFAEEKKPDATLKLSQAGCVGRMELGAGVLTYKGKDYPFKVDGLSVGDVKVTKAEAVGKVSNLKKISDFNGTYTSACGRAQWVEEPESLP